MNRISLHVLAFTLAVVLFSGSTSFAGPMFHEVFDPINFNNECVEVELFDHTDASYSAAIQPITEPAELVMLSALGVVALGWICLRMRQHSKPISNDSSSETTTSDD